MRHHIRKDPFDPSKPLVAGDKAFRTWDNKQFVPGSAMPPPKGKVEVRRYRLLWEQRHIMYEEDYLNSKEGNVEVPLVKEPDEVDTATVAPWLLQNN